MFCYDSQTSESVSGTTAVNSNPQPIVFLHIPKCAGTSIRRALEADGRLHIIRDYQDKILSSSLKHRLTRLRSIPKSSDPGVSTVYFGHFTMRKYKVLIREGARTATFLRDPVERYISHVNHWLLNPDPGHNLSVALNRERITPIQLAEKSRLHDLYAFMMDPLRVDDFDFVGVQELFSESVEKFNSTFNLTIHPKTENTLEQALEARHDARKWLPTESEKRRLESIFGLEKGIYNDALSKLRS